MNFEQLDPHCAAIAIIAMGMGLVVGLVIGLIGAAAAITAAGEDSQSRIERHLDDVRSMPSA